VVGVGVEVEERGTEDASGRSGLKIEVRTDMVGGVVVNRTSKYDGVALMSR